MNFNTHRAQRSRIIVAAVVALFICSVVAGVVGGIGIGTVAAQAAPNGTPTNTTGANTIGNATPTATATPKSGSAPTNNTSPREALKPNDSDKKGGKKGDEKKKTDGLLDADTTWGEFSSRNRKKKKVPKNFAKWVKKVSEMSPKEAKKATKKNPKKAKKMVKFLGIAPGISHPKKMVHKHPRKAAKTLASLLAISGGGGGGGGGSIIGWAWDALASLGDMVALFGDEMVGKTVKAFFHGARAFFSWIFGFFIAQAVQIVNQTIDAAVKAMTMTPHPTNPEDFYQNPQNGIWSMIWNVWEETGQPVARLIWLASLLFLMAFGNQIGIGTMDYAQEKQAWIGLLISVFFITDAGWTLTQLIPVVVDAVTQSFVSEITSTPVLANAAKGVVIVFALILLYFEAFFVLLLMLVAAFRIELIIAFAPFIPALVVGRFSPFETFSSLARAGLQLWFVLLVAALPSVLLLNASFTMAQAVIQGQIEALSALMAIPLIAGGLLASALMPFLLWKGTNRVLGSGVSSGIPGVSNDDSFRDKMQEYRGKADRPNRFQRGFRRKDAKTDERTGSHRAGRGIRNDARNAERKVDNAGQAAKDRAEAMKSWLDRNTS